MKLTVLQSEIADRAYVLEMPECPDYAMAYDYLAAAADDMGLTEEEWAAADPEALARHLVPHTID